MGKGNRGRWAAVAVGVTTAIAAVDAATPEDLILIALLSAGPIVAATRLSPRTTALISLYALALGLFLGLSVDDLGSEDLAIRIVVLAAICLVAVWAADLGERLRRSRDQLQAILDNVADGVTAQEPGGR